MSRFLTPLRQESIPGRKAGEKCYKLISPFSYMNRNDDVVTVPIGFEFDGASVPRVMWWLFPPFGRYREAAAIHDYLYVEQKIRGEFISRDLADLNLLWGMEDLGVAWWKRQMIYRAVRLGGWVSYNQHTKKLKG